MIGLPLLLALLGRQARENTAGRAFWSYGLFLLVFFFVSRFLNENYLGYIVACLVIGALAEGEGAAVNMPGSTLQTAGE